MPPKPILDPGPEPPPGTDSIVRERWRKDNERFLTEGGRAGVSDLPANVDSTDRRLQKLRQEHHRFLDLHSPMKAALWLALLRPAKDIIHDAEMTKRFRESQAGLREAGETGPDRPAIVEIGNQLVAAALAGDRAAIADISERIEGRVGLRVGDEDPDDPAKRKQSRDITERVVRALTAGRMGNKAAATDVEVIDVEPVAIDKPAAKE